MTRISDASVRLGICARWEAQVTQWSVSGWCTHPGQTDCSVFVASFLVKSPMTVLGKPGLTHVWGFLHLKKGQSGLRRMKGEAEKAYLMTKFRLSQDSTVIAELLKAEREQVEKNRRILHRLVDTTLFLARQGLAFRGHREHAGLGAPDSNEGNFLELLKLLAHYDSILEQHMNNLVSRVTYLSHQSQNELIAALSKETLSTIIDEIKSAKFFSVIVDSTIDITRMDQFSLSL